MKKCAEFGTNEAGRRYCARFENVDDIAVAKKDGDSLGYFDIGEVTRAMGSLGKIGMADVVPPLVGATGAVLTTLLIRKFVTNPDSLILKWAPVGGALGGVLASIPLYWFYGKQGVIKGALVGAAVGGGLLAVEKLSGTSFFSGVSGMGLLNIERRQNPRLGVAVASGPGLRPARMGNTVALPSAKLPASVGSAMDVTVWGKPTY